MLLLTLIELREEGGIKMNTLDKMYDRAYCEVEDILGHQKLDKQDVEILGELVDIIKDVEMIYGYQNDMDDSYMRGRSGRMMPMYGHDMSYIRGRSMDSGNAYEDNRNEMMNHLAKVADMAMDEKDRKAIERLMSQMSER